MISITFIDAVLWNADRINEYQLGGDGDGGKSDCIGLIIGSVRHMGLKWTGTHGTNYAVRNEMRYVEEIRSVSDLSAGDLVYKRRSQGDDGYDLPDKYATHTDKHDYYHVGVVLSVSPLSIVHCTGVPGGIAYDNKLGKWSVHGTLKMIENQPKSKEEITMQKAIVSGGNQDKPINFRAGMSTNSTRVGEIPQGAEVDYYVTSGDWAKVGYGGQIGYVMSSFVRTVESVPDDQVPFWFVEKIKVIEDHELAIRAALYEIYERIGRG